MISLRVMMMEAVQKENWYLMVLVVSLALLKVSEQQKDADSTVALEDGMVLHCLCPWNGTFSMVSWTKEGESSPLAVYHPDYGVNFFRQYEGRVTFLRASPMDGSISISRVSEQDLGRYHCSLQTFPHGSWTKHVQVINMSSAPPAPPAPENRTLSCHHVHDAVLYEVSMEKVDEGGVSRVLAVCSLIGGEVKVTTFLDGGSVNCSHDLKGMELHLDNQEEEHDDDGGFYRCNFSTDTGNYSSTINLTTPTNPGSSVDSNRQWIIIGGGIAGALGLMGVAACCMRSHRMKRRGEYGNHTHLTQKRHTYNLCHTAAGEKHSPGTNQSVRQDEEDDQGAEKPADICQPAHHTGTEARQTMTSPKLRLTCSLRGSTGFIQTNLIYFSIG